MDTQEIKTTWHPVENIAGAGVDIKLHIWPNFCFVNAYEKNLLRFPDFYRL
jgi:hypothetical protein